MQTSSLPSTLGSHLSMENPRSWDFHLWEDKSGFAAVCALWPYIRDVHISIMCLLQSLFQGESRVGTSHPEGLHSSLQHCMQALMHEQDNPRRNALH